MQQGRFPATGMMIHHPHAALRPSVAVLITNLVAHFWKADPTYFSKASNPVAVGNGDEACLDRVLHNVTGIDAEGVFCRR